jgi:Hemopexin
MWNQIDSCLVWPTGKAYLFSGPEYVRYDIATDRVDDGYPKPIAENWPGLWTPAGAGIVWPNGKAYFLRGSEYMRYDIATDRVDDGYPKPIAGNWPGLSLHRVDAGLVWPNKKAYLFGLVGNGFGHIAYIRYDIGQDRQDDGYPKPIAENWHGLPSVINAATVWPNGKAYFFFGNQYARYDIGADRVDDGYPKPIAGNWPGVPITSPAPPDPPH